MDQEGASHSPSIATEPVRSRWSPKPEQILILESIFNSGIVNPPKDETVRIRKMLEKFGAVGDANVFYWFQNRRSRSRRKQRQLQAATAAAVTSRGTQDHQTMTTMSMHHGGGSNIDLGYGSCSNTSPNYFFNGSSSSQVSSFYFGLSSCSSSSTGGFENNNENLFTVYGHESDHQHHQLSSNAASTISPSDQNSNSHYQQGLMTVFINGVPTEVTKGAIDTKTMFGEDLVLLHSSGLPLPTDEFGFLMQSLQHGQSYFLVPRQT